MTVFIQESAKVTVLIKDFKLFSLEVGWVDYYIEVIIIANNSFRDF